MDEIVINIELLSYYKVLVDLWIFNLVFVDGDLDFILVDD